MSRFNVRKRLRKVLRKGRGELQITRYPVTFVLPNGIEQTVEAEEHYTLLMASQALDSPIGTGRRAGGTCPDGGCALCRVEILDGTGLNTKNDAEQASMDALATGKPHEGRAREPGPPLDPNSRLGCYAKVIGPGARVQVRELFDFDSIRGDPDGT